MSGLQLLRQSELPIDGLLESTEIVSFDPMIAPGQAWPLGSLCGPGSSSGECLALKDRALAAAAEGSTIANARSPHRPIVYANDGFERLTGYRAEEILGRNCRFLQGADTDPETIEEIRAALRDDRPCQVELLNYKKCGEPFGNRLSITPVKGPYGEVTHYIGVQSDITAQKQAEAELRRAKEALRHLVWNPGGGSRSASERVGSAACETKSCTRGSSVWNRPGGSST